MLIKFLIKLYSKTPKIIFIDQRHSLTNLDKYFIKKYKIYYSQRFLGSIIISFFINFIWLFLSLYFLNILFLLLFFIFFLSFVRFFIRIFERYFKQISDYLDSILFLIKSNFNLFLEILPNDADLIQYLIKLIYSLSVGYIKKDIKNILSDIQKGIPPEKLILEYETPSENFNNFLKISIISNFNKKEYILNNNILENEFKIFNKSLETRISIYFFIGFFFPIGINFSLFLGFIRISWIFFLSILYFLILNNLNKSFINKSIILIGINNKKDDEEYKILLELFFNIIYFLKYFNLEDSFIEVYNIGSLELKHFLNDEIHYLKNFNYSLEKLLDQLNKKIINNKNKLLFNIFSEMLLKDSYKAIAQLNKILKVLKEHLNLQMEKENIIKGEKLRASVLMFLLPLINGLMLGIFIIFIQYINKILPSSYLYFDEIFRIKSLNNFELILLILDEIFINIFNGYFINKTIQQKNLIMEIFSIIILFSISLFLSIIFINNFVINVF